MENLTRILHFAHIYQDIDKQMKFLKTLDNKLEFKISEIKDGTILYKGKKSKISLKSASTQLFGFNLELTQWIDGECPHKDFLDQGKEGLHHVTIFDGNIQSRIKEYQEKGIDVLFSSQIGGFDVAYIDTVKIFGVVLELFGPHK